MSFVYKSDAGMGDRWAEVFARQAPQVPFHLWPDVGDPMKVRFLGAWVPPEGIADRFPNLEVLFSSGAGVDQFDLNGLPPGLTVVRMVEPGIVSGMVEYVTWAVLALHRDVPLYDRQQRLGVWAPVQAVPAHKRRVGVLGPGSLGRAALAQLRNLGFDCAAWGRTARAIDGVRCFAGAEELSAFLARTEILVCLLPLTSATRGFLDSAVFNALPAGASLVHVGRGQQLVAADLLEALRDSRISHAILDVTEPEPLPASHAFWSHPNVTLTPHIAGMTQPESAAEVVIDNLRRFDAGLPMVGLVDRSKGY